MYLRDRNRSANTARRRAASDALINEKKNDLLRFDPQRPLEKLRWAREEMQVNFQETMHSRVQRLCCVLRTMGLGRPMPGHCRVLLQAVVDLGVKEFVCLSRAKNIRDLVVEPMAFDRLSRLGESPTLKARMTRRLDSGNLR